MNEMENTMIQTLARRVRYRNIQGNDWPGKPLNAPAVTSFPNILSEIEASGMCLWCPAQHANVSKEVMAAVLEDNEDLTLKELFGLCHLYGRKPSYMIASTIQIIDPAANKGKARRRALADTLKQADGLDFSRWRVDSVLDTLNSGKPVTYAAYRWAMDELRAALDKKVHKSRAVRRVAV